MSIDAAPTSRHRVPFMDRREAGCFLAADLEAMEPNDPLIVALPRDQPSSRTRA